jgi:glutathione-regulated potassium-efflux system ancillary protein KefC
MEIFLLAVAFVFGFLVKQLGLPPLVGFLCAGFALNLLDFGSSQFLEELANVGILLLLFSIGLKVQIKKLFEAQIWGTASLHMVITTAVLSILLKALGWLGISYFGGVSGATALLLAFALSFSSTVFAVKILEEKEEMTSKPGRIAIGILIMQDLFAVIFITFSSGTLPSPWALLLVLLIFVRKPLMKILNLSGHGELLVLLACILPLAGAQLFELVGLKPDLGALVLGMMLAGGSKTDELAKAMLGFKDLFLVGFFLTIGLAEMPHLSMLGVSLFLVLLIPFKTILFFLLLTRMQLRARTALISSATLAHYSEFGLIVGAVGYANGWLSGEWLVILALTLSVSMIAASLIAPLIAVIYARFKPRLKRFETAERLPEDREIDLGGATVAVLGMGRIGTAAYDNLRQKYGKTVVGLDFDEVRIGRHEAAGRQVIHGDANDEDFWSRGFVDGQRVNLVLLAMCHNSNVRAAKKISSRHNAGVVGAIVEYEDQIPALKKAGVTYVFNAYSEAGAGFSEHICGLVSEQGLKV